MLIIYVYHVKEKSSLSLGLFHCCTLQSVGQCVTYVSYSERVLGIYSALTVDNSCYQMSYNVVINLSLFAGCHCVLRVYC